MLVYSFRASLQFVSVYSVGLSMTRMSIDTPFFVIVHPEYKGALLGSRFSFFPQNYHLVSFPPKGLRARERTQELEPV